MYRLCVIWCTVAYPLTCVFAQEAAISAVSRNPPPTIQSVESTAARKKWISQIFLETETLFDMANNNVSEPCAIDYEIYKLHANNQSTWAIRMMESSEWPRVGVFSGMTTFLGNYRECLRSRGPANIQGQYCLAKAAYNYSFAATVPSRPDWVTWPPENASVWNVIKNHDTVVFRVPRRELTWALCIPSSCSAADVQKSLTSTLHPVFEMYELDVAISVDPINCRVDKTNSFSFGFFFTVLLFIIMILLVISSTTYHVLKHDSETQKEASWDASLPIKLMLCFSAVNSWKTLTKHSSNTYTPIYTIKFVSLILMIIAHQSMQSIGYPRFETEESEMMYQPWTVAFSFHAVADIFLMISGFLTFYFGFAPTKKNGLKFMFTSLVYRWLRLMPVLGAFLLLFIFVVPYLGDGPFWNTRMMNEVQYCYSNWWTELLAVNNIVHEDRMCLISTWYLAVEMQLTIVGSVLLLVLSKSKRTGIALMILTFLSGISATFLVILRNNYPGVPTLVVLDEDRIKKMPSFRYVYIQMYSRIGSYLLGCAIAVLINSLEGRKYELRGWQKHVLLLLLANIGWGSQSYAFMFFIIERPYYPIENAVYGSIHRIFFVLPIAGYLCIYFLSGDRSIIDRLLSIKMFVPLGRLCYTGYLISYPFQLYQVASSRRTVSGAGVVDIMLRVMCDIGFSLLLAFLFYFITEGPINSMLRTLEASIARRLTPKQRLSPMNPPRPRELRRDTPTYKGPIVTSGDRRMSVLTLNDDLSR